MYIHLYIYIYIFLYIHLSIYRSICSHIRVHNFSTDSSMYDCIHIYMFILYTCIYANINKPPNIDINGQNIKAKSLSNARRALLQANSANEMFWAALVVDSIEHPVWWPRARRENCSCCDDGDVPNYHQVIIGSGETDIGIHIDNAPKPSCGSGPRRDFDMVDIDDPQYNGCLSAVCVAVAVTVLFAMAVSQRCVWL